MVSIVIFTDKGEAYCMGRSPQEVAGIVEAFRDNRKIKYIRDTEKRFKFLGKAVELIEGREG